MALSGVYPTVPFEHWLLSRRLKAKSPLTELLLPSSLLGNSVPHLSDPCQWVQKLTKTALTDALSLCSYVMTANSQ